MTRRTAAAVALVGGATLAVYLPVVTSLVRQWASDENYSHGFLVVPFALLFAWKARWRLQSAERRPSAAGLLLVVVSLACFVAGQLAAELFLTRISLVGVCAGTIVFLWGPAHLRRLTFPLALVLLAIPLPAILFNHIAFPLQMVASRAGEAALTLAGLPVLREGNVLILPNTSLEVAEACSGIRSLAALVTLALILGKCCEPRRWARVVLAVLAVPVAVLANAARVAGTGLAAAWVSPRAAEGFFHAFAGIVMFVAAFLVLLACARWLGRLGRHHPGTTSSGAVAAPSADPAMGWS